MAYEQWDIVLALFPFVDEQRSKPRPVAVLSARHFNQTHGMLVGSMITTAAAGAWESDHTITDLDAAGLKKPCVVRFKIVSLPLAVVDRRIGSFAPEDRTGIAGRLHHILPLSPPLG